MAGEDIAVLGIKVTSDDVLRAVKRLDKLENQSKKTEKQNKKLSKSFGGLKAAIAALGVGLLTRQLIGQINSYTTLTNRLRLVTKSSKELSKVQDDLFDLAQKTRGSLESTVDLYSRLALSTEKLGLKSKTLLQVTENVNKAVAVSGTTSSSAQAALFQFGQALGANAFKAEEMNSILEQTPRLAQLMADGLNKTKTELKLFGSQGKLTADIVIKSILSQTSVINKEFGKTEKTIAQAGVQISNTFLKTFGTIKGGGIVQSLDEFRSIISDPKVVAGIKGLVQGMVDLSVAAFKALGLLTRIGESIGKNLSKALSPVPDRLRDINFELSQLEIQKEALIAGINRGDTLFSRLFGSDKDTIAVARRFDTVREKIIELKKERDLLVDRSTESKKDSAGAKSTSEAISPGIVSLDNTESELARVQKFEDQLTALKLENLEGRALAIAEFEEERKQLDDQVLSDEIGAILEFNALKEEIELKHQNNLKSIDEAAAREKLMLTKNAFGNIATLMQTGSKTLFEIGKVAALAQGAISLSESISTSYAAGSRLGGPVLGTAFAAAAGIAQAVNLSKIASTSFGSRSAPASNSAAAPPGIQPLPTFQDSATQNQQAPTITELRVTVDSDGPHSEGMRRFAENLAETIKDMGGVQSLVVS